MKKTVSEVINDLNVKWAKEGGRFEKNGYIMVVVDGKPVREHRIIAEKALGKPLPLGARVYHVDGNKYNNNKYNLVVYDIKDQYHRVLHYRTIDLFGSYESLRSKMRRWRLDRKRYRQKVRKKIRERSSYTADFSDL